MYVCVCIYLCVPYYKSVKDVFSFSVKTNIPLN